MNLDMFLELNNEQIKEYFRNEIIKKSKCDQKGNTNTSASQNIYLCKDSAGCFESSCLLGCVGCVSSFNLYYCLECKECESCAYCVGCTGLKNAKYQIYNKQYTEQEFRKYIALNQTKIIKQSLANGKTRLDRAGIATKGFPEL